MVDYRRCAVCYSSVAAFHPTIITEHEFACYKPKANRKLIPDEHRLDFTLNLERERAAQIAPKPEYLKPPPKEPRPEPPPLITNAEGDLKTLFGSPAEVPPPEAGSDLVSIIDVQLPDPLQVQLSENVIATFATPQDAREVLAAGRPRRLPRISKMHPKYYWVQPDKGEWLVIEYNRFGENVRARFHSQHEACVELYSLQRRESLLSRIEELGPRPKGPQAPGPPRSIPPPGWRGPWPGKPVPPK